MIDMPSVDVTHKGGRGRGRLRKVPARVLAALSKFAHAAAPLRPRPLASHILHTQPNTNVECQSFLCALSAFDELLKENRAYV